MTDITDPTKPVAWTSKAEFKRMPKDAVAAVWPEKENETDIPLYGPSLLSEYERMKAKSESRESEILGMIADLSKQVARSEALEAEVKRLREALDNARNLAKGCEHDGGFDREIGPIGCMLGDKCVCVGFATVLREALETIADPRKLPSHGDPTVLREAARAALEASR